MPRGKRNTGNGNVVQDNIARPEWVAPSDARFINIYLNDVDQQWLLDNGAESDDVIAEFLTSAAKEPARVSIIPDARSGRFNATYASYCPDSSRYGFIVSVRASTPTVALYALAYSVDIKSDTWNKGSVQGGGLFN